jgi:hypothetical protein
LNSALSVFAEKMLPTKKEEEEEEGPVTHE